MQKEETKFQKTIINYLNSRHILNYNIQATSNLNGFPDLLVCYKGRFVAFELKYGKGKPTTLQERTMQTIREAGGYAVPVWELSTVKEVLEQIDKCEQLETFKKHNTTTLSGEDTRPV